MKRKDALFSPVFVANKLNKISYRCFDWKQNHPITLVSNGNTCIVYSQQWIMKLFFYFISACWDGIIMLSIFCWLNIGWKKNSSWNSSVEIQLIQLQMPSRNVLSCSNLICLTISACFSTLVAHGDYPNIYYLLLYLNGYMIFVNFTSLYALIVHISFVCTISKHLRI